MRRYTYLGYLRSQIRFHLEQFIAKRLYGHNGDSRGGSRPASFIVTIGVAIGIAVMILSLAITRGFKSEIREKVTGFTGDIQVQGSFSGTLATEHPVAFPDSVLESLRSVDCIDAVRPFVNKPCIIRTDKAFHGLVLKGIGRDCDQSFLKEHIVEGAYPELSDSTSPWILLSKEIAGSLGLSAGSKADVHFMQNRIRMRRVTVAGIFETGFAGYDNMTAVCGMDMLQKLNGWDSDAYSGLEVELSEGISAEVGYADLRHEIDLWQDESGQSCLVRTAEQINSGLFAWLGILDMNVWIILALMMGIAGFTMVSGLLIIIFERTQTIGVLKSLGAGDRLVRRIFLRLASYIILKGMAIGNLVAVTLCLIQKYTCIIPLDPVNYYIDHVPVQLGLGWLVILNAIMLAVSMFMMLIPTAIISRIDPARSMRFE